MRRAGHFSKRSEEVVIVRVMSAPNAVATHLFDSTFTTSGTNHFTSYDYSFEYATVLHLQFFFLRSNHSTTKKFNKPSLFSNRPKFNFFFFLRFGPRMVGHCESITEFHAICTPS